MELIVASTLLTLIMTSVYSAFTTTIRTWRTGEANLKTYQDARFAMNMLSRELQNNVYGVGHLFEGDRDSIEFYAVTPALDVDKGEGPRVMWVRYRLKSDPGEEGSHLYREEAIVKSPLPLKFEDDEDDLAREERLSRIRKGSKRGYELASGVLDFDVYYLWLPEGEDDYESDVDSIGDAGPPEPVELIEKRENRVGWGLPQGLRIAVTLVDENAEEGETTFETTLRLFGPTAEYDEEKLGEEVEL